MALQVVPVEAITPEVFAEVAEPGQLSGIHASAQRARELLSGRRVWNINSTASGGGVAEMLHVFLAYARGADIDARWLVIDGTPAFFEVTKRLHNRLHGASGDTGLLGQAESAVYEKVMADNTGPLLDLVSAGDVVILHDPQTLGLAPALRNAGLLVAWRCHVGADIRDDRTQEAWNFLGPWLPAPHVHVFSRPGYVPEILGGADVRIIPPAIDPLSPKNRDLTADEQRRVLRQIPDLPPTDAPTVLQVSRWDRLKDMAGVMEGFVNYIADRCLDAHLVLAGPATSSVTDDPEGAAVLSECMEAWRALTPALQRRVHLVQLPMDDLDGNALMVNALQRRADVVVQKSLVEGFGLTVAEAMWKARPVVGSAIGGIQDQIVDGQSGRLIQRPADLASFGKVVSDLLEDKTESTRLGTNARQRVREHFLAWRDLEQWVDIIDSRFAAGG
jgi:trehalose synthase